MNLKKYSKFNNYESVKELIDILEEPLATSVYSELPNQLEWLRQIEELSKKMWVGYVGNHKETYMGIAKMIIEGIDREEV